MAQGAIDTLSRQGLESYIFGDGSRLSVSLEGVDSVSVVDGVSAAAELPVWFGSETVFGVVIASTMVLYLVWIMQYVGHRYRGDYASERWIYGDKDLRSEKRFAMTISDVVVSLLLMLGVFVSTTVVGSNWLAESQFEILGGVNGVVVTFAHYLRQVGVEYLILGVAAYLVVSSIWFAIIYVATKILAPSSRWCWHIIRLKARMMLPIMLFFMPFVILSSLMEQNNLLCYVVAVQSVALLLIYIIRSFLLFAAQKISILQWFLYLCAVEILPITFVWAVFVRSVSII